MTDDLVTWLRAQFDEDEQAAGHLGEMVGYRTGFEGRWHYEIEAKRRLLDYLVDLDDKALDGNWWSLDRELPFQLLALPYADRPGYREEWRP